MAGLSLTARTGHVDLVIGTSSSGDNSRTLTIPFGSLDSSGLPKAIGISIQGADGIPIPQTEITCQAFQDDRGTITLGAIFSDSSSASFGPSPVKVGSIFCSDARGVKSWLSEPSNSKSSLLTSNSISTISITPSTILTITGTPTTQQPLTVGVVQSAVDDRPKTLPQTAVTTITAAPPAENGNSQPPIRSTITSAGTIIPTDIFSHTVQSTRQSGTIPATAQQKNNGADFRHVWELRRILVVALVTVCLVRYPST